MDNFLTSALQSTSAVVRASVEQAKSYEFSSSSPMVSEERTVSSFIMVKFAQICNQIEIISRNPLVSTLQNTLQPSEIMNLW